MKEATSTSMRRSITMNESSTLTANHFTACATLAALGAKLSQLALFGPIRAQVQIRQKTIKHTPIDKLIDAFISWLAGAHGLVEINTRLRADLGLQRAFGRGACAEQSVVQETWDACTAENVGQLRHALDEIYRSHSQGFRHDYQANWHLLDLDMSGLPCGRHPRLLPPGGTLPGNITAEGDNWGASWLPTPRK
jgi:hypothetical protein